MSARCRRPVEGLRQRGTSGLRPDREDFVDGLVDVTYVQPILNPEDMAVIPGTRWVITTGLASAGHPRGGLRAVHTQDLRVLQVFPRKEIRPRSGDDGTDVEAFSAHGLSLRAGPDGIHDLAVVHHGSRESIELFRLDATGHEPALTWERSVPHAENALGNAVVALGGGRLAATNQADISDPDAFVEMAHGEDTGDVVEYNPANGWRHVPGTAGCGPNGLEADDEFYYVALWGSGCLLRASRTNPGDRLVVELGFRPDNLHWHGELLLIAGHVGELAELDRLHATTDIMLAPSVVALVDPASMTVERVAEFTSDVFGFASTAIVVEDRLWVSSARCDRILTARRPANLPG